NNAATCTKTFTVSDTTPPTVACKPFTLVLDNTGHGTLTAANITLSESDNCGVTQRTLSKTSFTCADLGSQSVALTVKDAANNSAGCNATVTVQSNCDDGNACTTDACD